MKTFFSAAFSNYKIPRCVTPEIVKIIVLCSLALPQIVPEILIRIMRNCFNPGNSMMLKKPSIFERKGVV